MGENDKLQNRSILIVEDDPIIQKIVSLALNKAGFDTHISSNGKEALSYIDLGLPDLIISDVMMPEMDGFELLKWVRSDPKTSSIPMILLTSRDSCEDVISGMDMGADDYLPKPFDPDIMIARVKSKINRPPIPAEKLILDRSTGFLNENNFRQEAEREIYRSLRGGKPGCFAYCEIIEIPRVREQLGVLANREISKQIAEILQKNNHPLDIIGYDSNGRFLILLPELEPKQCQTYLHEIELEISRTVFKTQGEKLRLTPIIGYSFFSKNDQLHDLERKNLIALEYARSQIDLDPKVYDEKAQSFFEKFQKTESKKKKSSDKGPTFKGIRTWIQAIISVVMYLFIPFFIYWTLDKIGTDITPIVYYIIVIALLITAIIIWIEGFLSVKRKDPPDKPNLQYPPASAIIAAYLPNEAFTILETLNSFLNLDYPNNLQIILAYNTPKTLPIEIKLNELAEKNKNLKLLRVEGSESKSQNVNAAISHVTGEFVGIFDADHHPDRGSFIRAWKWLEESCDVVQGHCLVRNHDASFIARMVSVEFEAIYAVSHPGRTRLYGFGIFGGSNGFWKTELLRQIRMHGFMMTEDIDSSMRVTEQGYKIVTDPLLVSRELAPGTLTALWHQRMRWSQGWFQVSLEHFRYTIRSKQLNFRQKLGAIYLLLWRELYPWISAQMFPVIAFWAIKYHGLKSIDWLIPIFVLTTLFTLSVGPGQAFFAWLKADDEIKKHKGWFWQYFFFSSFFYTEFKNIIARVAQIKEIMHERSWRITPRNNR